MNHKEQWIYFFQIYDINPQAPVTQKTADEVVFRRFQGEGVPISALPDFIFQWVLYQDHVLSQMVL